MTSTETAYRNFSIGGASPIGLMLALFDRLVVDFQRAAAALRENDIETRCREMNHATLVLGQLESWLDLENGGDMARDLARFYGYLRAKMLEASASKSAAILEAPISYILHVRSAWQQLDTMPPPVQEEQSGRLNQAYAPAPEPMGERIPFSQSA